MKLKHLMYIFAASLMLFSVSVPATAAIAKEPTASTAANATPDGYPNSSNGGRGGGGGGGGYSAPGGFKGPAKPAPKPKPKSNKGKKSKKKNSKKKKKKKKKAKTQAQKYNEAKKKGKKVKGNSKRYDRKKGVKFPESGKKYSSADWYINGKLNKRRYFGKNGKPQVDIHYSDHGNPKLHPKVPHRHNWFKNKHGKWQQNKNWY